MRDNIFKTLDPASYKTEQFDEIWDNEKYKEVAEEISNIGTEITSLDDLIRKSKGSEELIVDLQKQGLTETEILEQIKTKIKEIKQEQLNQPWTSEAGLSIEEFTKYYDISDLEEVDPFKGLTLSAKQFTEALSGMDKEIKTVAEAMKEYEENGEISAETALSLIEANENYATALKFTKNGIELDTNALKDETAEKINNLKLEIENEKQKLESAKAILQAKDATEAQSQALYDNTLQLIQNNKEAQVSANQNSITEKTKTRDFELSNFEQA